MTTPPPVRVRHAIQNPDHDSAGDDLKIIEVGWSPDPQVTFPPTLVRLVEDPAHVHAPLDSISHDPSDATLPGYDTYPYGMESSSLLAPDLVETVARHWERVHPHMQRFTHTELEAARMLAATGGVLAGLRTLADRRPGHCEFTLEEADEFEQ